MTDCTVIIPIGPGHEKLSEQAMQSVMMASDRRGRFDVIHCILGDDTKGEIGRSAARNRMVAGQEPWMPVMSMGDEQKRAFESDWLFFLDADDLMCSREVYPQHPLESAFEVAGPYLEDYDCIWGAIYETTNDGPLVRRNQVGRITTYEAYVKTPAPLSCQMGHFVRRDKFPGFNEDIDVCEDVDLYLREWKNLRCIKQERPLMINRRGMHTWMRGGLPTGRDWSIRAQEMLKAAREAL